MHEADQMQIRPWCHTLAANILEPGIIARNLAKGMEAAGGLPGQIENYLGETNPLNFGDHYWPK